MFQTLFRMFKQFFDKQERTKNKINKFIELEKSKSELNEELDFSAEQFQTKTFEKSEAMKSKNELLKSEVEKRYNFFIQSHIKNLGELKKKKDKIDSQMNSLIKGDAEFQELVEKEKTSRKSQTILSKYRNEELDLTKCDLLLKAVTKEKVKYADNIVFNEKGEILLLKRSEMDESNPGKFTIPGGHVDFGEDCETAAKRELFEEAGIKVDRVDQVGEYEDEKVHIKYYQSYVENADPVLQEEEIWSYEWIDPRDIDEYELPFNMGENITKILFPIKHRIIKIKKSQLSDLQKDILIGAVLEKVKEDNFFKAWDVAQVGEIRERKDGKKYKKVSNTGSKSDWKLVSQSKDKKQDDVSDSKVSKKEDGGSKQYSESELKEHAKNTSESSLNNAIKDSDNPDVRKTAHEELDRRDKEEKPQEESKEGNKEDSKPNNENDAKKTHNISEETYSNGKIGITIGEDKGSRVSGYVNKEGDEFQIKSTFVNEEDRGKGLAKSMYKQLLEELKKRKVKVLKSDVQVEEGAGRIYNSLKKEGFDVRQTKGSVLENDPSGNFWWNADDDTKSPFEIHLKEPADKQSKITKGDYTKWL